MLAVQRYHPQAYPPSLGFPQFGDDQLGRALRRIDARADARAARKLEIAKLHHKRLDTLGLMSEAILPPQSMSPEMPKEHHGMYAPDGHHLPMPFQSPPAQHQEPQKPPPLEIENVAEAPAEQTVLQNFFDAEEPASPSRLQRLREQAGAISDTVRGPLATAASATFVGTNTGIRLLGRAASSARNRSVSIAAAAGPHVRSTALGLGSTIVRGAGAANDLVHAGAPMILGAAQATHEAVNTVAGDVKTAAIGAKNLMQMAAPHVQHAAGVLGTAAIEHGLPVASAIASGAGHAAVGVAKGAFHAAKHVFTNMSDILEAIREEQRNHTLEDERQPAHKRNRASSPVAQQSKHTPAASVPKRVINSREHNAGQESYATAAEWKARPGGVNKTFLANQLYMRPTFVAVERKKSVFIKDESKSWAKIVKDSSDDELIQLLLQLDRKG